MAKVMTKYQAEQILGLSGTYTFEELNKAYRTKVTECHPDVGGSQDEMINVNLAKNYLSTYFDGDKSAKVTCSTTDTAGPNSTTTDEKRSKTAQVYSDLDDMIRDIMSDNGSENDAPFYEGGDYTKKPQSDWTKEDWDAFKNFQPPREWEHSSDYAIKKVLSWNTYNAKTAEASNINVERWNKNDWFYYWLTNARNKRDDNIVYVRLESEAITGPESERARAKKLKNYTQAHNHFQNYAKNHSEHVRTPYGTVDASSFERFGWTWNVGMPFAYAATSSYEDWVQMNIEAQKEALFAPKNGPVIAETPGYTGVDMDDFNTDEDKLFIYGSEQFAKESKRQEIEYEKAHPGAVAPLTEEDKEKAAAAWQKTLNRAKTAEYRNMGLDGKYNERLIGQAKLYYNRNKIPNAPAWYNFFNAILNKFPWRTALWVVILIGTFSQVPSGDTFAAMGWLVAGTIIGLVNISGYFTNMIRGPLRGILDGTLKIWAKATHTDIDWDAARDVTES